MRVFGYLMGELQSFMIWQLHNRVILNNSTAILQSGCCFSFSWQHECVQYLHCFFVESCVLHSRFIYKLDWLMAPVSLLTSCFLSSRKAKSHRQNYVYIHPFLLSVAIHWLEGCDPGSITKTNPAEEWLIDLRNQRLTGGITFKTAASPWFNWQDPCQTFTA